jgi:hypothetical protein
MKNIPPVWVHGLARLDSLAEDRRPVSKDGHLEIGLQRLVGNHHGLGYR